jgi:endonuclease YncB( thermonuclease family)
MLLALKSQTGAGRAGALLVAAACFAAGLTAGALIAPLAAKRSAEAPPPVTASRAALGGGHPAEMLPTQMLPTQVLPTQVLRVIDGDTFLARVHVWPGIDITTKVRLRGIDAPEMRARCEDERTRALAARDGLTQILGQGEVGISRVGQDKYGGRVDAAVATASTPDVSQALLARGLARRYFGGRRESWCG